MDFKLHLMEHSSWSELYSSAYVMIVLPVRVCSALLYPHI